MSDSAAAAAAGAEAAMTEEAEAAAESASSQNSNSDSGSQQQQQKSEAAAAAAAAAPNGEVSQQYEQLMKYRAIEDQLQVLMTTIAAEEKAVDAKFDKMQEELLRWKEVFKQKMTEQQTAAAANPHDAALAGVADISSSIKDMQFLIHKKMKAMNNLGMNASIREAVDDTAAVNEAKLHTIAAKGHVMCVAKCSNLSGFVSRNKIIVSAASLDASEGKGVELNEPCLFVSFKLEEQHNFLLQTDLDGDQRNRFYANIDWTKSINALHCDSDRQHLYIAQPKCVTLTDLCGAVLREIRDRCFDYDIGCVTGIDGNEKDVFVFDCQKQKVLALSKDTGEFVNVIDTQSFHSGSGGSIALLREKLLITDPLRGKMFKVNCISRLLIAQYPTQSSKFSHLQLPVGVAVDTRGLMYITEWHSHTVRVMLSDGTVVQTLGRCRQPENFLHRFHQPWGLTIVDVPHKRVSHLVVADGVNKRLKVWELE